MKITVNAAAKLNLFLDILANLCNGFHSLFMIMQSIDLYDTITVSSTEKSGISVTCSDTTLPSGEGNIAHKAALNFFEAAQLSDYAVNINITKRIPHAAGLAGGSADAAAVIYALNKMYHTDFSLTQLSEIGVKVGADVPFCLCGGTMLAQNMGEVLTPLPKLPDYYIVLVKPDCAVSTKDAFAAFDKNRCIAHPSCTMALFLAASGDYNGLLKISSNVFEQFIEVPDRVSIRTAMRKHGCKCFQMSGSGPSVFGIFDSKDDAENCVAELQLKYENTFLCRPVERSITIK